MLIADENLVLPTITREEILRADPLLRLWLDRLHPVSFRSLGFLVLVILLPLTALAIVAGTEGRLAPGSLDCRAFTGHPEIVMRGMSFLGDSMVWPFIFLIPLAFLLLSVTIDRFAVLFHHPARVISQRWLKESPAAYLELLERVRDTFQAKKWGWKAFRGAMVALGLGFFLFNLVTCTYTFGHFRPYEAPASRAWTQAARESAIPACSTTLKTSLTRLGVPLPKWDDDPKHGLSRPILKPDADPSVPIAKWDTDPEHGLASWAVARLWVLLFGYSWLPLLAYKIVNLVAGLRLFIEGLTDREQAGEEKEKVSPLEIQQLSPDGAGGLSMLSATAYSCLYPLLAIALMLGMTPLKETAMVSVHDLLLVAAFIPLFIAAFLTPLLSVHGAMQECRDRSLTEFSLLFNEADSRIRTILHTQSIDLAELNKRETTLRFLREYYERIKAMPVWPFHVSRILGVLGGAVVSAVPKLISRIIQSLTSIAINF